jgi:hypothetical protein
LVSQSYIPLNYCFRFVPNCACAKSGFSSVIPKNVAYGKDLWA